MTSSILAEEDDFQKVTAPVDTLDASSRLVTVIFGRAAKATKSYAVGL